MKIFFLSDIHGSLVYAKEAFNCFEREAADQMVILGDVLYHGPRNPLPEGYNPAEVAELLNLYKEKIVAVRGNCDSEVDQTLIEYPMMSDYIILQMETYKIFVTHGHIYSRKNMPLLNKGDAFIQGHIHLPVAEEEEGIYYLNPGSITLPRENNANSYGILESNVFTVKAIDGRVIKSISIHE